MSSGLAISASRLACATDRVHSEHCEVHLLKEHMHASHKAVAAAADGADRFHRYYWLWVDSAAAALLGGAPGRWPGGCDADLDGLRARSEEHTSELQSHSFIS